MIYSPSPYYYVEIRNNIAFVVEIGTERTIGYWKDKKYFSYALHPDITVSIDGTPVKKADGIVAGGHR